MYLLIPHSPSKISRLMTSMNLIAYEVASFTACRPPGQVAQVGHGTGKTAGAELGVVFAEGAVPDMMERRVSTR
jgi:hypothetical protein